MLIWTHTHDITYESKHTLTQIRKPQIVSSNGNIWKTCFKTLKYICLPGDSNDLDVNIFLKWFIATVTVNTGDSLKCLRSLKLSDQHTVVSLHPSGVSPHHPAKSSPSMFFICLSAAPSPPLSIILSFNHTPQYCSCLALFRHHTVTSLLFFSL